MEMRDTSLFGEEIGDGLGRKLSCDLLCAVLSAWRLDAPRAGICPSCWQSVTGGGGGESSARWHAREARNLDILLPAAAAIERAKVVMAPKAARWLEAWRGGMVWRHAPHRRGASMACAIIVVIARLSSALLERKLRLRGV